MRNIFNKIGKKTTKKFVYEEKIYKNGELYIKKVVKHGDEANEEIEKSLKSSNKMFNEFMSDFFT